jgi:hypothetical protein
LETVLGVLVKPTEADLDMAGALVLLSSVLSVFTLFVSFGAGGGAMGWSLGKGGTNEGASQVEGMGSDEMIFTGSGLSAGGAAWVRFLAMLALKACL